MQTKISFHKNILGLLDSKSFIVKNFEEIVKIFGYKGNVCVSMCNSPEELAQKSENKSIPDWVIACNYRNQVFVLNPKEWKNKNATSLEKLIVHEIIHVILNDLNSNCPIWLSEGLALWYADQIAEFDLSKKEFINPYLLDYSEGIYACSANIIKRLFDVYPESFLIERLLGTSDFNNDNIFGVCALEKMFLEPQNITGVSEFYLRQMKADDINELQRLWRKLAVDQLSKNEYAKNNENSLKNIDQQVYFENCLRNDNCQIFVAEYQGLLVGFAEIWIYKKDFIFDIEDSAYIMHFFVDKDLKTYLSPLSITLKLFRACEYWAWQNNLRYLCSDVYGFNTNVQKLLERVGAKPYKIRYVKRLDV